MATATIAKPTQAIRRPRPSISTRNTYKASLTGEDDDWSARSFNEPCVRTTGYILKKFRGKKPSLKVHLHPTFFRFDQQEGTFSYKSEMRTFVEHLQKETIPHELVEEFLKAGVPFYDGCLIVEVHNHRTQEVKVQKKNEQKPDSEKTFSLHKYNEHITPSPYAPFPDKQEEPANEKQKLSPDSEETEKEKKDKHDMPAPEPKQKKGTDAQVFTIVLHPTDLSRHSEMMWLSTVPLPDTKARKGSATRDAMTPTSSSTPVPSTPGGARAGNKPVKMLLEESEFYTFEADYLLATEPPLILEPAKDFDEAQTILDALEHPLHSHAPTSTQTRKRTQADMAADDAQVVREEQRMLILDERVKPSVGTDAAAEGQNGTAQLGFTKFKTLETIKQRHEEKERQRKEEEHQATLAKREHEAEMLRKRKLMEEQRKTAASQHAAQQQQMMLRQQQLNQQKQQQMQNQMQQMNGLAQNPQQQAIQQQAAMNHSSPIVRNQTPMMNSSPMVANASMNGGFPMQATASNQGAAGSPPRPSSAMHQAGMARQVSQQQHPSRNNTPGMTAATPHMASSMPMSVDRQMSATPRMNHGSPAANMQGTPNTNMMNMSTPQMNQQPNLTPQQVMHLRQQQQQRQMMQQQQMQNGGQQITAEQIQARMQNLQMQAQTGNITPQAFQAQMNQLNLLRQRAAHTQAQAQAHAQTQAQAQASHGGEAMAHSASQNPSVGTPTPQPNQQMTQQQMLAARARAQQQAQLNMQLQAAAAQNGGQVPAQLKAQIMQQNNQQYLAKQQQMTMRAQQAAVQQTQALGDPSDQETYMRNLRTQQAMMARMSQQNGQMNMQGMQGMNMQNMQNMQGMMNQNMMNMNGVQGMNGMQGMQGINGMGRGMNGMGGGMNMQQMQQMQARMQQQAQQQAGGGDLSQHFASMQNALNQSHGRGM